MFNMITIKYVNNIAVAFCFEAIRLSLQAVCIISAKGYLNEPKVLSEQITESFIVILSFVVKEI